VEWPPTNSTCTARSRTHPSVRVGLYLHIAYMDRWAGLRVGGALGGLDGGDVGLSSAKSIYDSGTHAY
jgi:hypothetical protein